MRQVRGKFIIYGLVDPRDLLVHYVGQSSDGEDGRPRQSHAHGDCKAWIAELRALGLKYIVVTLEVVNDPKAPGKQCYWWTGLNATALNDAERWWIAYGRALGWPLTNKTTGGQGVPGWSMPEHVREKIAAVNKAFVQTPEGKAILERAQEASLTPEARIKRSESASARVYPVPVCGTREAYQRALKLRVAGESHCGPCRACTDVANVVERVRRQHLAVGRWLAEQLAGVSLIDIDELSQRTATSVKAHWDNMSESEHRQRAKAMRDGWDKPGARERMSEAAKKREAIKRLATWYGDVLAGL